MNFLLSVKMLMCYFVISFTLISTFFSLVVRVTTLVTQEMVACAIVSSALYLSILLISHIVIVLCYKQQADCLLLSRLEH